LISGILVEVGVVLEEFNPHLLPQVSTIYAMHWLCIHGLAASVGVRLRATGNGDQPHPMGP